MKSHSAVKRPLALGQRNAVVETKLRHLRRDRWANKGEERRRCWLLTYCSKDWRCSVLRCKQRNSSHSSRNKVRPVSREDRCPGDSQCARHVCETLVTDKSRRHASPGESTLSEECGKAVLLLSVVAALQTDVRRLRSTRLSRRGNRPTSLHRLAPWCCSLSLFFCWSVCPLTPNLFSGR